MTRWTIKAVYITNNDGDFNDPSTGKCWNIPEDRQWFRKLIKGGVIICGRKTFLSDYNGLKCAAVSVVLTQAASTFASYAELRGMDETDVWTLRNPSGVQHALASIKITNNGLNKDGFNAPVVRGTTAYCVGGKQTLEAILPYCDEIIATIIFRNEGESWYPAGFDWADWRIVKADLHPFPSRQGVYRVTMKRIPRKS